MRSVLLFATTLLLTLPAFAQRIEVTIPTAKPLTGHLILVISKKDTPEPRMQMEETYDSAQGFGIGPRMRIASADYIRTYFGTSGAMPGTGGLLQRFNAGLHSYGALAQATYHWSDRFQTTTYLEYKRLTGDAARSPIVRPFGSRNSLTIGISASYSFDTGSNYSLGF